jgi:sarcosine oxidase delta subunit
MDEILDSFLMNDQAVTCPHCGSRTEFEEFLTAENTSVFQIHQCIDSECLYKFEMVES